MSILLISLAVALADPGKAHLVKPPPKGAIKPASKSAKPTKPVVVKPSQRKPSAQATVPQTAPPSNLSFEQRLLAAHNGERVRLGLKPLVWSTRLSADARKWADNQAKTNSFEHAPTLPGGEDQGENLWMGTIKSYTPEQMVGAWIDERRYYVRGPFPRNSSTGNWVDVGHYTQLIWHKTSEVGCAIAANRADEYLVCRYLPPGNWEGEDALGSGGRSKP